MLIFFCFYYLKTKNTFKQSDLFVFLFTNSMTNLYKYMYSNTQKLSHIEECIQYYHIKYTLIQYVLIHYSHIQYFRIHFSLIRYSHTLYSRTQYSLIQYSHNQYSLI